MLVMSYEDFLKYVGFSAVENNPEKRFYDFIERVEDGYSIEWVFDAFTGVKFKRSDALFFAEKERGYIGPNPDLYEWYMRRYVDKAKENKEALLYCWGEWPICCGLARALYSKPENFGEFVKVIEWIENKECEKTGIEKDTQKEIEELAKTAITFAFDEVINTLYQWDKEEGFNFPTTEAGYYLTLCVSVFAWMKENEIFNEMRKYSWKC